MKCPYTRLEYDSTYNQWYGFDEFGTSITISLVSAENYKRIVPFTIVSSPDIYQQRLDKVLSKFDCKYKNGVPYIKLTLATHIVYFLESFKLSNDCATQSIKIPLDTVELLLRDLEANNE